MDEATSSVDGDTDARVQAMLRDLPQLSSTTTLTVAHRLHTIIDYDKVVVLDSGRCVEAGAPRDLVQLPDGWFSARPRDRDRDRDRRLLDERFLLLDRLRSFLRRERLRLRLRERLLLPSSSFSALLERERLLLFETEEASESSSRAIFCLVCRGDGV